MRKSTNSMADSILKRAVFLFILAVSFSVPTGVTAGELILKKGDRVAIVGDSITEQMQYSKFLELYMLACAPELEITTFQFGWGGETAPGFASRMESDMVPWKPTVVTTCYGMNDGRYSHYNEKIGKAYRDGMRRIQERCKQLGVRMIVAGPGAVDTDTWKANEQDADKWYNDNLAELGKIAGDLATENGFVFADLHPQMMKVMRNAKESLGKEYHVCGRDGVHPSSNGHVVMAYAFLKAMGFDGEIGTIIIDMRGETKATKGHSIISSEVGKVEIESSRYPFCFYGDKKDPDATRSILPFVSFNQDLNRYTLIVKNLSAGSADVTWGKITKTFTKAELEQGINLADEFLDNPFSVPFKDLENFVAKKQDMEKWTIKGMGASFRSIASELEDDPEVEKAIDMLRGKLLERCDKQAELIRMALKTVRHVIQVNPREVADAGNVGR